MQIKITSFAATVEKLDTVNCAAAPKSITYIRQNATHYFDYRNAQTDKQPQFICFNQPASATPKSFPAVTTLRDGLDENVHTSAAESAPACDEERAKILHSERTPKEAIVNINMPTSQEARSSSPSSENCVVVTVQGSILQPESDYFAKIAEINEQMKDALIVTTKRIAIIQARKLFGHH